MTIPADAHPTKELFIDMLTRDISMEDAVLDLVDNSIDAACVSRDIDLSSRILSDKQSSDTDVCDSFVKISIDPSSIRIEDNCGGIGIERAKEEVFVFGRSKQMKRTSLGVYGIGLKRGIFKLGKEITIVSRTTDDGFETKIDVDKWSIDPNWQFSLDPIDAATSSEKAGTEIQIRRLHQEIKAKVDDGTSMRKIRDSIAKTYPFFLGRFVKVFLNKSEIGAEELPIGSSEVVKPAFETFDLDGVKVDLMASLAARKDGKWKADRAGWYILCNGRVVVSANKDSLTGWGDGGPIFVSKYAGFLGIAFFSSDQPALLPWTTTKRGLNVESAVFQQSRNRMKLTMRPILRFLNKLYPSEPREEAEERQIADGVSSISIQAVAKAGASPFRVEPRTGMPPQKTTVRVQFDAEMDDLGKVRKKLRKSRMSASAIGKYALDYFIKQECPDE